MPHSYAVANDRRLRDSIVNCDKAIFAAIQRIGMVRTQCQVLATLAVASCSLSATELYNLDFAPPEVGAYQTVFGNPSVQPAVGPFTNTLVFQAVASYDQIRLPITTASPRYLIQYDVLAHNLLSSPYAFTMLLDTPDDGIGIDVRSVSLHGGLQSVRVYHPFAISNVVRFVNDQVYRFAILVDLESNLWSVTVDGTQRFARPLDALSLQSVRFDVSPTIGGVTDFPGTYAALDNIRIRAVSRTTPPTLACSAPLILECTNGAAMGTLEAEVLDISGNPLEVLWSVDGTPYQTNDIPSGGTLTITNLTFVAEFGSGLHDIVVSVSNGQTNGAKCSTTVTVHDTIPPEIASIAASPHVLWPPNHVMVPINVMAEAVDTCGPSPLIRIVDVGSNEPQNHFAPDFEIIGPLSVNLRAQRSGKGNGRVYTIVVQAEDENGNSSFASVNVTVPHSKR
jgi:hypothetical protein